MNNINYKAYSGMLTKQVQMCFPFEHGFYLDLNLGQQETIGDIGCGNAAFSNKLALMARDTAFYCYDNDPKILDHAVAISNNIELITGNLNDFHGELDIIFIRLVLHQVEDIEKFISTVVKKVRNGGRLIIIDTYDKNFKLVPKLSHFFRELEQHRKNFSPGNASRDLLDLVINKVEEQGLQLNRKMNYFVPSTLPEYREYYRDYMLETGNIFGMSNEARQEILSWYENEESYAQIGLFLCDFIKHKKE